MDTIAFIKKKLFQRIILEKIIFLMLVFTITIIGISSFSLAYSNVAYGYLNLEIKNDPPEVTSISLQPNEVYEDSTITCLATVVDEDLKTVKMNFEWHVDGKKAKSGNSIDGLKAGEEVKCAVMPIDSAQQVGEKKYFSSIVQKSPVSTKIIKTSLNVLGSDVDTYDTLKLQNQGFLAISGFAVNQVKGNGSSFAAMIFLIILLVLVNINLILRIKIKREQRII